ncbi:MAG: cyclic nucleotide-binding domain-containing protein [Leptospiraceae bacterium]|nr:cyclic nucleotide-binding domain-containing protein [Leptospiraceae bacterium]
MKPSGEILQILKKIELFSGTSIKNLEKMAKVLKEEKYKPDELIISQGEDGTCLYIIYTGRVNVHIDGIKIAEIAEKQTFGESSLLNSEPRNASIFAKEESTLLRLDQSDFYRIMGNDANFMRGVIKILIHRLSAQNQELIETLKAREKELTRLVDERTKELHEALDEIKEQKKNLEISYKEIEEKNYHITQSISYAKKIQKSILPTKDLILQSLPDSFILFRPRDVVSGDFYWFYEHKDKKNKNNNFTIIAAVDCTGHGVPGALMSMIGNGLLNDIVKVRKITNPSEILNELNIGVEIALNQKRTDIRDGMDIALCKIIPFKKEIQFSGAMNSLYYIGNNHFSEIKGERKSIGGGNSDSIKEFKLHTIKLTSSTIIYIYSDGYMHQFGGEHNKKFSSRKFKELLFNIHNLPMPEQKFILEKEMVEWMGQNDQLDDMLVIGVKIF